MNREHEQQVRLFTWIRAHEEAYPDLQLAYAVPNGAPTHSRFTGKRLHDEGVRRGVPDVCLPVPRFPCHGLYVENKVVYASGKRSYLKPDQRRWIAALRKNGYQVEVAYSAREAGACLLSYLGLPFSLLEDLEDLED